MMPKTKIILGNIEKASNFGTGNVAGQTNIEHGQTAKNKRKKVSLTERTGLEKCGAAELRRQRRDFCVYLDWTDLISIFAFQVFSFHFPGFHWFLRQAPP